MELNEVNPMITWFEQKIAELELEKTNYLVNLHNSTRSAEVGDRLAIENSNNYYAQLIEKADLRLKSFKKAINYIRIGHYGFCENCEEKLSEKRLFLLPDANSCPDCLES